jgi:RNA polymerase sigma-70 factor (ECF subfamily)
MVERTDREAIALLRRRDPRGFDLAYGAYAARVRGFLLRLCRNRALADDLLQQTFMKLAEHGPELRPDSDLRAWLFAVAHNACTSDARKLRPTDDTPLEALASTTPDVEARLLLGDVENALQRLRPDDREVLLLVGVEGLEPLVAAEILGIRPVALRQRLSRARARLLAELERATIASDDPSREALA